MTDLQATLNKLRLAKSSTTADLGFPSESIEKTFLAGAPVRLAVTKQNQPQLLLPASRTEAGIPLPSANGLDFTISRYKNTEGDIQAFIQIRCQIIELENVFLDLTANICSRIREGGSATECITAAIDEFRELLEDGKSNASQSKVIGLFGELLLLEKTLAHNSNAMNYWTGPDGGRRDFTFPKLTIEVKTTKRTQQRQATIHALDQLATDADEVLYLWFYAIEENPGTGNSITDKVSVIEAMLNNTQPFRQALKAVGYTTASRAHWDKWKWTILESQPYLVNDDFPKITNASFPNGAPAGISHVTYQVNLDNAEACHVEEATVMEYITE